MGLADQEVETAVCAASLHDIGKVGVPDSILLKPDKLTEDELAWIRKYPEWGSTSLRHLEGLQEAALLVLHQRERVDGSGYPHRLKGAEIPLGSRLIAVADSYDALTSNRPYRTATSPIEAMQEIMRCSGEQFDPDVVAAFQVFLEREVLSLL